MRVEKGRDVELRRDWEGEGEAIEIIEEECAFILESESEIEWNERRGDMKKDS